MSRLILVRHGSTAWTGRRYCGRADPPLSAVGRREAGEAAAAIGPLVAAGTPVRTSPLARARATAAAIAAATGGPVVVDERLAEVDVGAAEGLTYEEVHRRWPAVADALRGGSIAIDWPGGERPADVRRRITATIEDWDRSADLVVVGHGIALAVAISLLDPGTDPDRAMSIGAFRPGGFVVLEGVGVADGADRATGADPRVAAAR
jgi:ribonuclease H / adenosylcobalamin/alpha-ribazole phosphatase